MGMYNYTIRLYKYAKLTARESRICTQRFFSDENTHFSIALYDRQIRQQQEKPMAKKHPHLPLLTNGDIFYFFTKGIQ